MFHVLDTFVMCCWMERITCCELCEHGLHVTGGPKSRPFNFYKPYANIYYYWHASLSAVAVISTDKFCPVNQKGLHLGQNQNSIHLLLIPHKSHVNKKIFKIHKITPDMNIKQNIQNTNFQRNDQLISFTPWTHACSDHIWTWRAFDTYGLKKFIRNSRSLSKIFKKYKKHFVSLS